VIAVRQYPPLTRARRFVNNAAAVGAERQETVGERVRRVRLEKGLSQRQVAGPGVSYAYISRIESGDRGPSLKALRLLARRLGVTPEYLETGRRVPAYAERELRLADAELELRMGGDLDRAEAAFRSEIGASDDPKLETDAVFEARANAGLGLLAARRSEAAAAIGHLEAATGSGYLRPEVRPDLYETLGASYTAHGMAQKAISLFERCMEEVRERASDDAALAVRFLTYLALARSSVGDLTGAREALNEATARADRAAVPQPRIALFWALAISAWNEERSESAREYVQRAIGLLESTEDTLQLARAHVFCAQLLTLDGDMDEADIHLAAADRLLGLGADDTDIGLLRAEQAKVAAARGDAETALAFANEAARLLGDDVRYQGKKWQALGAAHVTAGDLDTAMDHYQRAVEALEERRQWREAAKVARESAQHLRAARRENDALEFMDRAAVLAARQPGGYTAR
jgi:transcriptional regulator with XRE-family HTH domain